MIKELTSFSSGHTYNRNTFIGKRICKLIQVMNMIHYTFIPTSFNFHWNTSLSQTVISSLAPSQLPIPGSFSLILITLPPPQLFVHSLHSPHDDHSQPNTSPRDKSFLIVLCSYLSFLYLYVDSICH